MSTRNPSPKAAVFIGVMFAAFGALGILGGAGVFGPEPDPMAPRWVEVCTGLAFVFTGAGIVNGFAIARGAAPDGDLAAGTPFTVRLVQYVLGLGAAGSLTAIIGWVAFGPGERRFTSVLALPFMFFGQRPGAGETSGRILFGAGAVMLIVFTTMLAITGAQRLRRGPRKQRKSRA